MTGMGAEVRATNWRRNIQLPDSKIGGRGTEMGRNPAVRSHVISRPYLILFQPSECGRSATWRLGQCRGPVFSSVTSNDRKRSNNAVLR